GGAARRMGTTTRALQRRAAAGVRPGLSGEGLGDEWTRRGASAVVSAAEPAGAGPGSAAAACGPTVVFWLDAAGEFVGPDDRKLSSGPRSQSADREHGL